MDDAEAKALSDIDAHGCHVIHVLGDSEGPCFTYSIGIEATSNQPELVITGLRQEVAHALVNDYNHRVRLGETFDPGKSYSEFLEGFDVRFAPVLPAHYKTYFGWGLWLYQGPNFRVHQLIWPSTAGLWPWDEAAPEAYTWHHPLLDR